MTHVAILMAGLKNYLPVDLIVQQFVCDFVCLFAYN